MLQLEEIDPKTLGQRIAEARKARGVTQEDVAEFLGYSRPTYIAIEKGERPSKADEIIWLGISVEVSTNSFGLASRSSRCSHTFGRRWKK
jgi:transcriptional regulator with XRE-family HTH domain